MLIHRSVFFYGLTCEMWERKLKHETGGNWCKLAFTLVCSCSHPPLYIHITYTPPTDPSFQPSPRNMSLFDWQYRTLTLGIREDPWSCQQHMSRSIPFLVSQHNNIQPWWMCLGKVAVCVYLGTNQVNRSSFPPPLTFLCNTQTQWTSSKFIGLCDHPHHFHSLSFLPARVPSPTWFLFGFWLFFLLPILFTLPHLLHWLGWEFNRSDHVRPNPID